MRYIQISTTDATDRSNVWVAATSGVSDSVMLHTILGWIAVSEYSVKFSDKPIKTGLRGKTVLTMDHLFD
jgi:hypothetical protein